ncbi:M23 family metallopeptidase [uncultured Polaribacter sp.]|uniref:M23 family metallopeptidase n=1 Tax=uncultured Polaribacter sp. TaxID=174711 RepID=UPI002631F10D|nr:M23 family metallopeptidase [uncultured Polaribacter sp.]
MKNTIFLFLLLFAQILFSQEKYPKNYFRSPLDIPIVLSGTFGELRSNHFHSGLDIKTQGKEGLPVFAVAEGYVSRIKVQQWGYGKAIYVTHPNGYTSVYGHLKKFSKEIEAYVKAIQYKKENYETGNIFPKKNKFLLKKGEIIAFSGDTGGSGGPHLHFEIRNTKTEHVINPMYFGITTPDTKKPTFQALHVYPLTENTRINQQYNSFKVNIKNIGNGVYKADKIIANGTIGFSINAFDRLNKAPNKNGIFSLEMRVNGKRHYYHNLETFSFAETKYLNLLIDYQYFKKYKSRLQRTFKKEANKLSIYKDLINNGKLSIEKGLNYTVEIIAKDFNGNKSILKIPVMGANTNAIFKKQKDTTAFKINAKAFHKFSLEDVTVAFPKNTFYEDIFLDFKVEDGVAKIHTPSVPLDKNYTLTFNVNKYTPEERKQLYIANVDYKKYPRYQHTRKRDSTFFTTTKSLGSYTLKKDVKKPTARILYFKDQQWITNLKTLQVKITDIGSGIKNWYATIDGNWVLMQYNHKKGILMYNFKDKKLLGSKHIFKIVVSDNVGNTTTLSKTFFRKETDIKR